MDISHFLAQPATVKLCTSYLDNVYQKHQMVCDFLTQISNGALSLEERLKCTCDVFQEAHRLKGSGGTYGFNEISLFYKEMLVYLRPPFDHARLPSPFELSQSMELVKTFDRWYPVLKDVFRYIYLGTPSQHPPTCHLLCCPSQRALFAKYELTLLTLKSEIVLTLSEWSDIDLLPNLPTLESIIIEHGDIAKFAEMIPSWQNILSHRNTKYILVYPMLPTSNLTSVCHINFHNTTLEQLECH